MARIPEAQRILSWRYPLILKEDDLIEFKGVEYFLREITDDIDRQGRFPYFTAVMGQMSLTKHGS